MGTCVSDDCVQVVRHCVSCPINHVHPDYFRLGDSQPQSTSPPLQQYQAMASKDAPATAPSPPPDFPSTYVAIRVLSKLSTVSVSQVVSVERMSLSRGCQFCGFWTTSPSPLPQACSGKWWPLLPWAFGSQKEPRGLTCLVCVNVSRKQSGFRYVMCHVACHVASYETYQMP